MPLPPQSPGLTPRDVARHYDVLDPHYRALWGEHMHHGLWTRRGESPETATGNLVRLVAERAGLFPGARVCDIGSGYGATARLLARDWAARVTAVTVSPLQHAGALAAPPVTPAPDYRLGDFLESGLPAGAFDAAIAVESLSHMPDLAATLAEVRRVVRPGGRFVACVWLARDRIAGWRARRLLGPICREGRLARLSTAAELRRALEEAGFTVEAVEDVSARVRRTWSVALARLAGRLIRDPGARRVVAAGGEAVFARTVARMWLAYRVGALRYGVFTTRKRGPAA
ncbi:MAG TPA: methyltransferase domain-containing protein [Longimicrobiales bacterium]|nr:methyltransferase domain-containing protein [Longimicrobiales bacterium]